MSIAPPSTVVDISFILILKGCTLTTTQTNVSFVQQESALLSFVTCGWRSVHYYGLHISRKGRCHRSGTDTRLCCIIKLCLNGSPLRSLGACFVSVQKHFRSTLLHFVYRGHSSVTYCKGVGVYSPVLPMCMVQCYVVPLQGIEVSSAMKNVLRNA